MKRGWTNRAPVRERCPRRTRSLWKVLALIAVAALPWGIWLAQHNECLSLVYSVDALRSQQEALDEVERRVRVELAGEQSLGDIENWAERKQGLVRPEPARVVIVPRANEQATDLVARTSKTTDQPADDVR